VVSGATYEPRIVQLGQANFDYTEVLSGLKEGDQVVLLTALTMQAQRDQQNNRFRQATGGGLPGVPTGGRGR
jgi:HlyD family secretion protein